MATNKRITELEVRIIKIEIIINSIVSGVNTAANFIPSCGQCYANPLDVGVCQQSSCPHGLNDEG